MGSPELEDRGVGRIPHVHPHVELLHDDAAFFTARPAIDGVEELRDGRFVVATLTHKQTYGQPRWSSALIVAAVGAIPGGAGSAATAKKTKRGRMNFCFRRFHCATVGDVIFHCRVEEEMLRGDGWYVSMLTMRSACELQSEPSRTMW